MTPARVVAFSSAKGGSGKTVTCASFGRALAALDQRVLIVDADADTSGMTLLCIEDVLRAKELQGEHHESDATPAGGLFDANGPGDFRSAPIGAGIDLLPTQYELAPQLSSATQTEERLKDVVQRFGDEYEYILLDAQAGADPTALAAATLANDVIIVSEYDPVSAQGVKRLEQLYPQVFSGDRTWILYNKVLPDIAESLGNLLRVEKRLNPIPWDAEVVRAYVSSTVPLNMDVPNGFTLAIVASIETLFRRRLADSLQAWRSATVQSLRAPIDDRVKILEQELDDLERMRIELRTRTSTYPRRRWFAAAAAFTVGLIAVALTLAFTPAGSAQWIGVVAVGGLALLGAVTPTILVRRSAHETELELSLARLERQAGYLNEELKQLAISSSSVTASLATDSDK